MFNFVNIIPMHFVYYTRVSIALRPLDGTKLEVTVGAAVGDIVISRALGP